MPNLELNIEKDWSILFNSSSEEYSDIIINFLKSERLSLKFENNFELWFNFIGGGWGRSVYNLSSINNAALYFTREEDIKNYRDVLIKFHNERDKRLINGGSMKKETIDDFRIVQLKTY